MRSMSFYIAAFSIFFSFVGCTSEDDTPLMRPAFPESPSPFPTKSDELLSDFESLSGLTIPKDAKEITITAEHAANLPVYNVRFLTSRGGAEQFCSGENFVGSYIGDTPTKELIDKFDIKDKTVDGVVKCKGSYSNSGIVNREAVALFPSEETVAMYVLVEK